MSPPLTNQSIAARPTVAAPLGAQSAFGTYVAILLLALGVLSALKGLRPYVDQTAFYLYYTDYRFGFILRGLIGQLFSPVLAMLPLRVHDDLLFGWHIATLALLVILLARLSARTVVTTGRTDVLAMGILLFCSPLIPSLAHFTAAPDVLLCLLTLGLVAAIRAQRLLLAWLIFLAGVLAHQLMIFLALPVMVLCSLVEADRPGRAVAGSLAIGVAACLLVLLAPTPDVRLIDRFIEHGVPPGGARSLYDDQLSQTATRMLGVMAGEWRRHFVNGTVAVIYSASAGAVILLTCLLGLGAARSNVVPLTFLPPGRLRSVLTALLVMGVGLSPLLVLAFAYDLSRLAVLSTFTSFLVADTLLRHGPSEVTSSRSRFGTWMCAVLAAVFFCLPVMGLWLTGAQLNGHELLVPNPILEFGVTREIFDGFVAFYNRNGS